MDWKNMTPKQKVLLVISCIAAAVAALAWSKPGLFPFNPTCPAIAVFTVCEALAYWKEKRKWSYLLLAAAVISMGCFLLELWLTA